ncbi:crotonase/enoyl-CoA hydratase family protein [Bradyrhizobium elkanii]|uniref:crotonase/enoyl-CoA hydratase family protein n=1 Tax=Bradyrhizobium elkanii TaxID=29448 RepID=UPI001BAB2858|nr:crotonase/enoyl-CoA hydratase family protein [Bradyrhizobium elkanii]MBR1159673.1 crotonase/enoyl-CoA hydratase family protein [Bradyrhizobium elkanii]
MDAGSGFGDFSDRLAVSQRGPVTLVQLSRPAKRNAIDTKMIDAIRSVFSRLPQGTRAVVLHGAGEHFCAGADLGDLAGRDGADAIGFSRSVHETLDRIEYGTVPVIAALHGGVIGGGLELAASAHIRVAERNTYFALPEGIRGIFVGGGGAVRIPRLIGTGRTIDMMLTGRRYSAEQHEIGFSQYLAENGMGLRIALELAEKIAANAPMTNFAVVQALPRIARADSETGFLMESLMVALAVGDHEAKTRIRDFLEKRGSKVLHQPAGK